MQRPIRTVALGGLLGVTIGAAALWAQAPWQQPGNAKLEAKGTVLSVAGSAVQLRTEREENWIVKLLPGKTSVHVTGEADVSFLRPGQFVRFVGEIDEKGALQGDLDELEIFTPVGKVSPGLYEPGASDDAKPLRKFAAGSYEVRAKLGSVKDGQLTVGVGSKKVIGKLADAVKIKVSFNDVGYVGEGDKIEVAGWYSERDGRPNPAQMMPGRGFAEELTVTLARPLEGSKKTRAAAPTGRAKPVGGKDEPSPFGFDSDKPAKSTKQK